MNFETNFNHSRFQQYLDFLKASGTSSATIDRKVSSFNSFQAFLIKKGYLEKTISPPSPISHRPELISPKRFLSRYLLFGTLIAIILGLGYGLYSQTILKAKKDLAYTTATNPIRAGRILSFQGRLTDSAGNPIIATTDILFKLYTSGAGGTELYTSSIGNSQTVTPDDNGIFSVVIGKSHGTEIPSSVFTENPEVWLEITAGNETMTPRQQIATVGYALNSETLQGLPPSASGLKDTVLVIDHQGNLNLGETSPTIKSTSGIMAIEGQALLLKASDGSGGNITINPDGSGSIRFLTEGTSPSSGGFIDLSNANIAGGNLINSQINNDNRGYNFLSFQNYNIGTTTLSTRFSVNSYGSAYFGAGITTPAITMSTGASNGYILQSDALGNASWVNATTAGIGTSYDVGAGLSRIGNIFSLNLGSTNTWLAPQYFSNNVGIMGNLGIGTTSPTKKLDVAGDINLTGTIFSNGTSGISGQILSSTGTGLQWISTSSIGSTYVFNNGLTNYGSFVGLGGTLSQNTNINLASSSLSFLGLGNTQSLFISSSGNVGIGTSNPTSKLEVNGNITLSSGGGQTITTAGTELILQQTGDTYGTTKLRLQNRNGVNGAVFENSNIDLVDFKFSGTSHSMIQRMIGTGVWTNYLGSPEFWFTDNTGINPSLVVGSTNVLARNNFFVLGNVGLGTTNPLYQLDMTGSLRIGGTFISVGSTNLVTNLNADLLDGYHANNLPYDSYNNWQLQSNGASTTAIGSGTTVNFVNGVGISLVQSGSTITVNNTGVGTTYSAGSGLTLASNIISLGGTLTQNTNLTIGNTSAFFINSTSGNVGIGTTSPAEKLEINGMLKLNSGAATDKIYANNTDGLIFESQGGAQGTVRMTIKNVAGMNGALFENVGVDLVDFGFQPSSGSSSKQNIRFEHRTGAVYPGNTGGQFEIGPADNENLYIGNVSSGFLKGNVGIGTTSPTQKLDINGSLNIGGSMAIGSTQLVTNLNADLLDGYHANNLPYDSYNNWQLQSNGASTTAIGSGTTVNFVNGVGISLVQSGSTITVNNIGTGTTYGVTNGLSLISGNFGLGGTLTQNTQIGLSSFNLTLGTNTTSPNLYLSSSGNVGIGNTNPQSALDINGVISIDGSNRLWNESGYAIFRAQTSTGIKLRVSNTTDAMTLLSSGNVGIGTTNPAYKLDVNGVAKVTQLGIGETYGSSLLSVAGSSKLGDLVIAASGCLGCANVLTISHNNNYATISTTKGSGTGDIVLNPAGNVGIGTTAPSKKLDVAGDINLTGTIFSNGTSGTSGQILSSTGTGLQWVDASGVGTTYAAGSGLTLASNVFSLGGTLTQNTNLTIGNTSAFFINSTSGNVGIGTTNPGTLLEVNGTFKGAGGITIGTGMGGYIPSWIDMPTGGSSGIGSGGAGTNPWIAYVGHNSDWFTGATVGDIAYRNTSGKLLLGTSNGGAPNLVINQGGNVGIGSSALSNPTLYITSSNLVGIGTTNPSKELDVIGDINLTGTIFSNGTSGTSGQILSSTGTGLQWVNASGLGQTYSVTNGLSMASNIISLGGTLTENMRLNIGNTEAIFINYSNGNVGIGTTNPSVKLDVNGNINTWAINSGWASGGWSGAHIGMGGGPTQYHLMYINGGHAFLESYYGDLYLQTKNSQSLKIGTSGITSITVNPFGNVGIGTSSPTQKLDINGSLNIGGSMAIGSTQLVTNLNADLLDGNHASDFVGIGATGNFLTSLSEGIGISLSGTGVGRTIALSNTTVTPGTYGAGTSIPTFTVDAQGRLTSAGSVALPAGTSYTASNGVTLVANDFQINHAYANTWTATQTFANVGIGATLSLTGLGTTISDTNLLLSLDASNNVRQINTSTWDKNTADDYSSWFLQSNSANTTSIGTGTTVNFVNGVGISLAQSGSTITINNTSVGTTYTAGVGLTLSSANVFSLNLGSTNVWLAPQIFNGGIGVTGNLAVGGTFISVGSTNLVTNLNANYLNGHSDTYFLDLGDTAAFIQSLTNGGAISITGTGIGRTLAIDYNTTNLRLTANQLNTIQNIDVSAQPTFARLGIGSTSSLYALNVGGTTYTNNLYTSGNVGIGTTNPLGKLHIQGTPSSGTRVVAQATGTETADFADFDFYNSDGNIVGAFRYVPVNGGNYGGSNSINFINVLSAPLTFGTNNTVRMTIDSLGNLSLTGAAGIGSSLSIGTIPSISDNNLVLTSNSGIVSSLNTTNWDKSTTDDLTSLTAGIGITITGTGNSRTIAFDGSQVGNMTFGSGSTFSWTFNAGSTQNFINFNNGNVGIGATNPRTALEVNGTIAAQKFVDLTGYDTFFIDLANSDYNSSSMQLDRRGSIKWNALYNSGWRTIDNGYASKIENGLDGLLFATSIGNTTASSSITGWNQNLFLASTGNVGIGTTNPSAKLEITATGSTDLYGVKSTVSLADGDLYTQNQYAGYFHATSTGTLNNSYGVYAVSDATDVNSDSIGVYGQGINAGIYGTSDNIGVNAYSTNTGISTFGNIIGIQTYANSASGYGIYTYNQNANGYALYSSQGKNYFSGNVGIGTTSPRSKLDILGALTIGGTQNVGLQMRTNTDLDRRILFTLESGTYAKGTLNGDPLVFEISGSEAARFNSSGYLGIGTTSPLSTLSVGGSGITGAGIYGIGSIYGLYGVSTSGSGYGVRGYAESTGTGVFGSNNSSTGYGVMGTNTSSGIGAYFSSTSGHALITGNGNVGIGTASPRAKLHVEGVGVSGLVFIKNTQTGYTAAALTIQNSSTSIGVTGGEFVRFLNSSGTKVGRIRTNALASSVSFATSAVNDFAEYVHGDEPSQPMDLIAFHGDKYGLARQGEVVAGTHSNIATYIGNENIADEPNSIPLTLVGIVDLKVNSENGPISPGDPISTSSVAGVGAKAISRGRIVGHAIEEYTNTDKNQIGQIKILVQPTYYDPDLNLTDTGEVNVNYNVSSEVLSSLGYVGAKNEIEAGSYTLSDSTGKIVTRISQFAKLAAAKIETGLLTAKSIIVDNLAAKKIASETIITGDITATTATVSGTLTTDKLSANEATISTLYADNIISKDGSFQNIFAEKISSLRDEIKNIIAQNQSEATPSAIMADASTWDTSLATDSANLDLANLTISDNLVIGAQLIVSGNTKLDTASVQNTLTVGQIAINSNIIETAATDLYIQPSALATIHFLNDRLVLSPDGNVTINGNLNVSGSLIANLLSVKDIQTETLTAEKINVATISALPNVAIADASTVSATATSSATVATNATAGSVTLSTGSTEIIIENSRLTPNSMVYLTPNASTQNQVLYVKNKNDTSFTIAIDQALDHDIDINWWLIN